MPYTPGMKLLRRKQRSEASPAPTPRYPIHGYSLGYCDTPREPFTWFKCATCGYAVMGSPYELPSRSCWPLAAGEMHETEWQPMDRAGALAELHAIESPEIVARTQR